MSAAIIVLLAYVAVGAVMGLVLEPLYTAALAGVMDEVMGLAEPASEHVALLRETVVGEVEHG